ELLDEVARFPHELSLLAGVLLFQRAGVRRHVGRLEGFLVVENRGIESAVEILVSLDEQMIGKEAPAVAQQERHETVGAPLLPRVEPGRKPGGERETYCYQQQQHQPRVIGASHEIS